jgi:iron complex outermembrane recepter protein
MSCIHKAAARIASAAALMLVCASTALAQGGTVSGQLVHSVTGKPVPGAVVLVEKTRIETKADGNGRFVLANVPEGLHHLVVAATGMMPRHQEVTVGNTPVDLGQVTVDPELHFREVVSVSPETRDQFHSYQPTTVLAGQDLALQLQGTVGATLAQEPGLAERSFGPGPSRPVIRGLDGDRVLILEDGLRTGDLSSQSGDHGVTVNPAAASRIEVIRGPATLLYGANAIGGLVNVISDTIPTQPVEGTSGGATFDLGTGADEGAAAFDVLTGNGRWALHAGASGRRSGDVRTPEGRVDNSQSRGGMGSVGMAWTGEGRYFGGSYGYDDLKYGVPVIEDGEISLTPRRHLFGLRTGAENLVGPFESFRMTFGHRQYRHDELHGDEVETEFTNNTTDVNLLARHRAFGRLTGSMGASLFGRHFDSVGEEALAPAIDERAVALFLYEELTWLHMTLQFGARINHVSFDPSGGLPARDFTDGSGSIGVLFRPAAANHGVTAAFNLARAARNPALEELYFFGVHHGNFAFEIGNPDLGSERALGFDAALRWRQPRFSGEITFFRNSIDNYIFRNPISEAEFERRFGDEDDHDDDDDDHDDDHGEFPFIEFVGANSLLQGIEAHADVQLARNLFGELGFDLVRGQLRGSGEALPRIPPTRLRTSLRYQADAFQAGGEWLAVARQDRVFDEERPTGGYHLFRLFGAYSFARGGAVHTLTGRLDNVTNTLYRNHLSLIKDFVPEMGRNARLVYSVRF